MGSHVAEILLQQWWSVLGIDDLSGFEANLPAAIDFRRSSIVEPLDEAIGTFRPDYVYHLAAYAAEGLSSYIPAFNCRVSIEGTTNVLAAACRAGVRHFAFTHRSPRTVTLSPGGPCSRKILCSLGSLRDR